MHPTPRLPWRGGSGRYREAQFQDRTVSLAQGFKLGFLVSHGGSSMRAILDAIACGTLQAEGRIAISNNAEAPGLLHARARLVPVAHISAATAGSPAAADRAIADLLTRHGVDLVVLSGYLRPVGPVTLARFRNRILNVHPALLPKFGGRGMFGRHVHAAVLAAGETETGATIHLVDGEYDHGPVLAQATVPVGDGDTVDDLQYRVMAVEPGLFVATLRRLADGTLALPAP
jgi:phosphoribosylglycinamide formyltransferase-1